MKRLQGSRFAGAADPSELEPYAARRAAVTAVRDGYLPGATHLPHDRVGELAPERLPDRDAVIVVYCAHAPCQNSRIAARELEALGYSNVAEYVEGKQGWVDPGLPLERTAASAAA